MICHKYNCIFIHVPKNAGTSIINSFDMSWGPYETSFLLSGKHSPKEHWIEYALNYTDYFIFSVVRNPWEKFISGWKYCESTRNKSLDEVLNNLPQDGHDFIHLTRTQTDTISYNNKIIPNFLLRMETLQEDYDKLCDILKKPRRKLKQLNKTDHLEYKNYFKTQKQIDLIYEHYHDDIINFNYKF